MVLEVVGRSLKRNVNRIKRRWISSCMIAHDELIKFTKYFLLIIFFVRPRE